MKKVINSIITIVLAIIMAVYPILITTREGGLYCRVRSEASNRMYLELLIYFAVALAGIKFRKPIWLIIELILFAYFHMMGLPALVSIAYMLLTLLAGVFINYAIYRRDKFEPAVIIWGIMSLTIIYAVLSLFKLGSVRIIQIFDICLLVLLLVWFVTHYKDRISASKTIEQIDVVSYLLLSVGMLFIMLEVGRANISLDYDSAWYGVRSLFCLDNNSGIYDDPKMIGCVYTYSKGYEVYMLPLNFVKSFTFVYAGNIMVTIGCVYIAYKICSLFLSPKCSILGGVLLSAIPGITNMGITAKSDSITLLFQLIMIYYGIVFVKECKPFDLSCFIASYIFSLALKPTSVIFSTTIFAALIFIQIVYRIKPAFEKKSVFPIGMSIVALGLMWLRTYMITGIPAGSVMGKLFRLMGFEDKYPYMLNQISQFRSEGLFSREVIDFTLVRIREFLFGPNSADTDHIALAWGTTLCTSCIIVVILWGLFEIRNNIKRVKENRTLLFIWLLFIGEFVGCLLSLWILSKPDGNYFMLYYSTTVVGAVILISGMYEDGVFSKIGISIALSVMLAANVILTGCATWNWSCSFSENNWINKGFLDQEEIFRLYLKDRGCDEVYQIITKDKSTKVFACGTHPDIERIPCVIESEMDVSFWGNAQLTASYENFEGFLSYEDYDYILIEPGYLNRESGLYLFLCELIDKKYFSEMVNENGFILLKCAGFEKGVDSMKDDFMLNYEE